VPYLAGGRGHHHYGGGVAGEDPAEEEDGVASRQEGDGEQLAQQPGHAGGREEDRGHGGGVEAGEGNKAGEESLACHQLDDDDAVHSDEQACLLPSFGETLHGASWWRVGRQVWICVLPGFL
jgi:hypothetical protein